MAPRKESYWTKRGRAVRQKMRLVRAGIGGVGGRQRLVVDPEEGRAVPEETSEERPPTPPVGPAPTAGTPAAEAGGASAVRAIVTSTPTTGRRVYDFVDEEHSPVRPLRPDQEANASDATLPILSGRRVVRIMEFISQIQADRHAPFGCSFLDSDFVGEHKAGFRSVLVFRCKNCNTETRIDTDKCDDDTLGINSAMVTGALAGGGGFANLDEIAAAADMPCMAPGTYVSHERLVGEKVEQAALESMLAAGREERRLAIEAEDFAPDGTPRIRVIADGMWSKRSYGIKYDAKSGTASIVGFRTRKVLFYGVRNKHCYLCVLDANKHVPVREHECSKNFSGSSGQMEAAIILEGFKASEEMHGLRYYQLVGDRDSSVYNLLVEKAPYGVLEMVQKIDCKNHLLRNYRSWTMQLHGTTNLAMPDHVDTTDRKAVLAMKKEHLVLRCIIRDNTRRLSNAISKASTYRGKEEGTLHERTQRLRADILNVAAHVFGDHTACAAYFCETARNRVEGASTAAAAGPSAADPAPAAPEAARANWVPRLRRAGLYSKLMSHLNTMADHAGSLIHNVNNNICEVANSQIAKIIAGKRIFYSCRNSFRTRCGTATLAMNSSGNFRRVVHKKLQNGVSPGKFTTMQSARKARKLRQQRTRRALIRAQPGARVRPALSTAVDEHYGLEARPPPEDEDEPLSLDPLEEDPLLDDKVKSVVDRLHSDLGRLDQIFSFQQGSHEWKAERRIRLTAANFGTVCKRRPWTSCKKLVHTLLYAKSEPTPSMKHGTTMEETARLHFETKYGLKVDRSGLVVDKNLPFLAASPDGLIGTDALLEIKCPTSGVDFLSAEDAARGRKLTYMKFSGDGSLHLDRGSLYHFQIQGQLHMTGRRECHFYVCQFTTKKNEPARLIWDQRFVVQKDDNFWTREMEPKLTEFYSNCLVKEISSPRYLIREQIDDIRELPSVLETIENRKQAKEKEETEKNRRKLEREEKKREMQKRKEEEDDKKKKAEENTKRLSEETKKIADERKRVTNKSRKKAEGKRKTQDEQQQDEEAKRGRLSL